MPEFWIEYDDMLGVFYLRAEGLTPGSLGDSLAKWEYLYEAAREGKPPRDGGNYTCALCLKYAQKGCWGCPISEYTGEAECEKTPYKDYVWAEDTCASEAAGRAAWRMVCFLKDLIEDRGPQ